MAAEQRPIDAQVSIGRCALGEPIRRCFLAYPVPATPQLQALLQQLPDAFETVHPADLHLTLVFLGTISVQTANAIWEYALTHPPPSMVVRATSLQSYGHPTRPRTWALRMSPAAPISEWMQQHQLPLLVRAKRPAELREPSPHISVGRLRGATPMPSSDAIALTNLTAVELQLDQLALYGRGCETSGDGPEYRVLRQREL